MADATFTIHDDLEALSRAAAQRVVVLAGEAIHERGAFHIALAGGNTPRRLYQVLSRPEFASAIDWSRVHLWFGDERCVPPDHPDSNYGMAEAALLRQVPIPPAQVHRIDVAMTSVRQDAWRYAQRVKDLVPRAADGVPCFDLILLGMGPDGHTASLFPGTCILHMQHTPAAAVYVEKFQTWRVSLTFPVLNHARQLLFLVAGADKAEMIRRVLGEAASGTPLPVQRIAAQGRVEWLLDKAAAAQLPEGVAR